MLKKIMFMEFVNKPDPQTFLKEVIEIAENLEIKVRTPFKKNIPLFGENGWCELFNRLAKDLKFGPYKEDEVLDISMVLGIEVSEVVPGIKMVGLSVTFIKALNNFISSN